MDSSEWEQSHELLSRFGPLMASTDSPESQMLSISAPQQSSGLPLVKAEEARYPAAYSSAAQMALPAMGLQDAEHLAASRPAAAYRMDAWQQVPSCIEEQGFTCA